MGRNNDTFTLIIDRNRETWSKFRRALRKEDQELFDELWRAPKLHLAAGAFIANEIPLETIFMSMLLEQHKKIRYLETAQYVRALDQADRAPETGKIKDGPDARGAGGEAPGTEKDPAADGGDAGTGTVADDDGTGRKTM